MEEKSPCCDAEYIVLECDECSGSGVVDDLRDGKYIPCEECMGTGYIDGWHECCLCGDTFEK